MKQKIIFLLTLIIAIAILSSCRFSDSFEDNKPPVEIMSNETSTNTIEESSLLEKEQAELFALSVVKTYFDKDCKQLQDSFSNIIYGLEDDDVINKVDVKDRLCNSLDRAVTEGYTYEDYLGSYKIRILDKAEYEIEFPFFKELHNYKSSKEDYLFIGYDLIDTSSHNFIWDDMFVFMVKKVDGFWKIIAL